MPGVLVAYAAKHGSTREVAEAVSERPSGRRAPRWTSGQHAACASRSVSRDLVVLGAPVYSGRWHRDAHQFRKRHRKELLTVPVAVSRMGPRNPGQEAWQPAGPRPRQARLAAAGRLSRCPGRGPRRGTVSGDATCGTGTRSGPGRPASVTTRPRRPRAQARPQVRDGRAAGAATGPCCIPRRWSSAGPGPVDRPVPPRYDVAVAHTGVFRAPPEACCQAARRVNLFRAPVIRTLIRTRPLAGGLAGRRDAAPWCRAARPGGLAPGPPGAAGTSRSRAGTLRRQAACLDGSAVAGQSWFSLLLRFR